ncbi:hypothetical protein JTB14_010254 [Gonioctena quinquepunctata]|nr:hypothetical protein JTB14_010254 [Gonioctena quinquepunctata]
MLGRFIQSIILYGAPIRSVVAQLQKNSNMLETVQRKTFLRMDSAYRKTTTKTLQVIARVVPIYLRILAKTENFGADKEFLDKAEERARDRSIERWQQWWDDTRDVASWTNDMKPVIGSCTDCEHKEHGIT